MRHSTITGSGILPTSLCSSRSRITDCTITSPKGEMMRNFKSIISLSVVVMLLGISNLAHAVPDPIYNTWIVKKQTSRQGETVRVIKLVRFSLKDANGTGVASGDVVA